MTAQARLSALLRAHVGPTLRAHGYNGSGKDYHRRFERNVGVVNLQSSMSSSASEVRFTINLGTASAVALAAAAFPPDSTPREYECHWRQRIGGLMDDGLDHWWTLAADDGDAEVDRLGDELDRLLVERALPAIDAHLSDAAILRWTLRDSTLERLAPAQMDVVGPILAHHGPRAEFDRYLAVADSASTLAGFEAAFLRPGLTPTRMGPRRTEKALAKLASANPWKRVEGAIELGDASTSAEIVQALEPLLGAPQPPLRGAAAVALGRHRHRPSLPRLQAMVRADPSPLAAVRAAIGLRAMLPVLDAREVETSSAAVAERRAREVGSARGALREVLDQFGRPAA